MFKTLLKSLREFKLPAILSPILISGEVVLECIIPMLIADLVSETVARLSAASGAHTLDAVMAYDAEARRTAAALLKL